MNTPLVTPAIEETVAMALFRASSSGNAGVLQEMGLSEGTIA